MEPVRRHHDMGGLEAGPIDREPHELSWGEMRIQALVNLISGQGDPPLLTVDQQRRAIENLGAEEYDRLSYYERWLEALVANLLHKGVITTTDLRRKLQEVEQREAADHG